MNKLKKIINKLGIKNKKGSALILTMFILTGMLIVAMSSSYVILAGIKSGGIQSQSTKAYFTADSGGEMLLWEMRKNSYIYPDFPSKSTALFSEPTPVDGASYKVYFSKFSAIGGLIFTSIGEYNNTKRSIELEFKG